MPHESDNLTFLEHLEELRAVLLKILLVFFLCCIPGWYVSQRALEWLTAYAAPTDFPLHYFSLMEPFLIRLKITAFLALVVSSPWSVHCLWKFLEPGLLERERKAVSFAFVAMAGLALCGAAIALLFIVPALVRFSLSFADEAMLPVIGIGDFTDLVLVTLLAAMVLFQFPVVLYLLLRLGFITLTTLRKKRPHVIVLIFILAAIFSPPDVMSQLLLAIPSWLLFEVSLLYFERVFVDRDSGYKEIYAEANDEDASVTK